MCHSFSALYLAAPSPVENVRSSIPMTGYFRLSVSLPSREIQQKGAKSISTHLHTKYKSHTQRWSEMYQFYFVVSLVQKHLPAFPLTEAPGRTRFHSHPSITATIHKPKVKEEMAELKAGSPLSLLPRDDLLDT